MKDQTPQALKRPSPSAGAVLLWCLLAGGVVAGLLLLERPEGRGVEFFSPAGTLRLLADLVLFYTIFLIPLFHRPQGRSPLVAIQSAAIVLYTAILGLIMLNYLVGLDGLLSRLVPFVVVVSAGALFWALALEDRRGVYYPVAAFAALGLPAIAFFCDELFRIEANWLDVISPFTAWRVVLDEQGAWWAAWVVFDVLLVSGAIAFLIHRRTSRQASRQS